jgi:hypothetical protein
MPGSAPVGSALNSSMLSSAIDGLGGSTLGSALDGPSNLPLGSVPKYFRRLATWLGA